MGRRASSPLPRCARVPAPHAISRSTLLSSLSTCGSLYSVRRGGRTGASAASAAPLLRLCGVGRMPLVVAGEGEACLRLVEGTAGVGCWTRRLGSRRLGDRAAVDVEVETSSGWFLSGKAGLGLGLRMAGRGSEVWSYGVNSGMRLVTVRPMLSRTRLSRV